MSDKARPPRRPLGERDDKDKNQPFGARRRDQPPVDPAKPKSPTDPYPWAAEEDKKPSRPPDPNAVPPTAPYSRPADERKPPAPQPDPKAISPTAPYPWADQPKSKPVPPPDPDATPPTAPYPWSDEAQTSPPPAAGADLDPAGLSWADLIAGVDQAGAAPLEAGLIDDAPPEPPLPGDTVTAEPPISVPAPRLLPAEEEAPPEPVSDGFLKRDSFLKRRRPARVPARSYLDDGDSEVARAPVTLQLRPLVRTLEVILGSALLVATLITWWTPTSFLPARSAGQLAVALATQGEAGPVVTGAPTATGLNVIGIVSGHRGMNPTTGLPDPGAVCSDGLTEESVNATIATKTAQLLEAEGYHVDVFDEFDPRLRGYRALAMVSIHADSCEYINDEATGFKVASFASAMRPEEDQKLVTCLINRYATRTGLPLHPSVTYDMTDYHNFREIDPVTPGAIIEAGFLYLDRNFLTGRPDDAAHGIADGVLCYVRGQEPAAVPVTPGAAPNQAELPSETPTPSLTPTELGPLFDTATPANTVVPLDEITPGP